MPLELSANLNWRLEGPTRQRRRRTLILDAEAHRYDKTRSDISGMNIAAHGNDVREVVRHVRDWLNANRRPGVPTLPGAAAIVEDHEIYRRLAPGLAKRLRLDPHDLPHGDYLYVVREALPLIGAARMAEQ